MTTDVETIRTYRFEVEGLPPRPGRTRSMWSKSGEIPRLIALRKAARKALGVAASLRHDVRVCVIVRLPPGYEFAERPDEFVAGVVAGLRCAAGPATMVRRERWWGWTLSSISPFRFAMIHEAAAVASASADIRIVDAARPGYAVEISGG